MFKFFINRPIVAMVIAIITVIIGVVSMLGLPSAQFPNIVPPSIQITGTYVGADAMTVEQSVATPIEQQMSGVDNMTYMTSLSANNGQMKLMVNFDVATDANTDQILSQMRVNQAESQVPPEVRDYGITTVKSTIAPFMLLAVSSPDGRYGAEFLANYAYINLNDQLTRVPGIASVTVFGAGQYAMRIWVRPDTLAKLNITIPEIVDAIKKQNRVNPAGQIGAEPVPKGQQFTYAVRSQGRLTSAEEFAEVVVRADPNGSVVRVKDVARIELGAQTYSMIGRLDGKPAAVLALYQLPGSNAITAAEGVRKLMAEAATRFPEGMAYQVTLDTTEAVTEGIKEIVNTLFEAMILVILVVFIFLQGWRATLIPAIAVPVSLIGTFAVFPMLGFSINTLSLFGLVLAVGLVVDDAIVVVEAVEHHIEKGLSPKEASIQAMKEVSGPVIAIALILAAVFLPTVFIPGITGRLYQQFAVTIAISMIISAFNALTLSPALCALILKPRKQSRGLLARLFGGFNRGFDSATKGYASTCHLLIRRVGISALILLGVAVFAGWFTGKIPSSFLPEEDQGYLYINVSLPQAASVQRTGEVCKQVEEILAKTPGVQSYTTVLGFSLLSNVTNTYSGFFWVTLKPWGERKAPEEQYNAITLHLKQQVAQLPEAIAFPFSPPAVPGIGTAGGVTFILQDRAGMDLQFLKDNTDKFIAAAKKRPELASVTTTLLAQVPQVFVDVDRDKALKQQVDLGQVYGTLQAFMGGFFVNYFNRFGRQWQVYVQAEGEYRTDAQDLSRFYVRNAKGDPVPLSTLIKIEQRWGPEFTMRYNLYRSAQINVGAAPGISSSQAMKALEDVFKQEMPKEMGFAYDGMSFQEQQAAQGIPPAAIFGISLLFVFLILAAQYESWSLPLSVLLGVPFAVAGAMVGLWSRSMENNVYAQIGLVMLIGLSAKNAILIVEFAKIEYEKGKSVIDAALEGARLRLRPILMTSLAFILGCVPLAIASGSGAISRQVMGTAVIGGMTIATMLGVFLIPACFYGVIRLAGGRTAADPSLQQKASEASHH